jgi:competence protein ComGF
MKIILGIKRKNAHWQNEKGFTMAEMLAAFAAFCMIAALLPLGLKTILNSQHTDSGLQRLEWEVFASQVKKETRMASAITVQGEKLILQKNGDTVLFEKFGTNIRRRVNGAGHEVILQNVAAVRFLPLPEGFTVQVKDFTGREYETSSRSFITLAAL